MIFWGDDFRSATSTAQNVTTSMTDSSSQSRDVVPKMFSTDETIFEDENGAKSNLDETEIVPETSLKLDLDLEPEPAKKSPSSLRLAKEPTDEDTQKIQLDSGTNWEP